MDKLTKLLKDINTDGMDLPRCALCLFIYSPSEDGKKWTCAKFHIPEDKEYTTRQITYMKEPPVSSCEFTINPIIQYAMGMRNRKEILDIMRSDNATNR